MCIRIISISTFIRIHSSATTTIVRSVCWDRHTSTIQLLIRFVLGHWWFLYGQKNLNRTIFFLLFSELPMVFAEEELRRLLIIRLLLMRLRKLPISLAPKFDSDGRSLRLSLLSKVSFGVGADCPVGPKSVRSKLISWLHMFWLLVCLSFSSVRMNALNSIEDSRDVSRSMAPSFDLLL